MLDAGWKEIRDKGLVTPVECFLSAGINAAHPRAAPLLLQQLDARHEEILQQAHVGAHIVNRRQGLARPQVPANGSRRGVHLSPCLIGITRENAGLAAGDRARFKLTLVCLSRFASW